MIFNHLFRRDPVFDVLLKLAEVQLEQQKSFQRWLNLFSQNQEPVIHRSHTSQQILDNLQLAADMGDEEAIRILSDEDSRESFIRSLTNA